MAVFGNRLYVGASPGAIWRTANGTDWEQVNVTGFGDDRNWSIVQLVEHAGALYAATYNSNTGTEVWRTRTGVDWEQVNADGFGEPWSFSSPSMLEFGEDLYVGTYRSSILTTMPCQVWRTSAWVFSDGFETGDMSRWSATIR
jgi:hypothetical protein